MNEISELWLMWAMGFFFGLCVAALVAVVMA